MDKSYFNPLLDAAELLGNDKAHAALLKMQSVYQEKQYFVAFIGQYSAGKSCLLNSLLRRRLLPEGTTETTPLLTYIRYGERELAKLHYTDKAVQILNIDEVHRLKQQTVSDLWDPDSLEYLEVFLHEDMLRSGMILLDTPGTNTLIEKHERLLEASLSLAASIVYVAGHSPSQFDMDKLSMLNAAGFEVSYIRTHCDEIKEHEETLEQVKEAERKDLSKYGVELKERYYVSNEAGSPLFAELEPLRNMLLAKGRDAGAELEKDIERQLCVQAKHFRGALENRRTLLEQTKANNTELLEKKQKELHDKIKRIESRLEGNEAAMQRRIEQCRSTLHGEVKRQLDDAIEYSAKRIEDNASVTDTAEMTALLRREVTAFSYNAYQLINSSLDPLVQEVNGEASAEEIELDPLALPQAADYKTLCAEQDELTRHLRSQLTSIRESREELTQSLAAGVGSPEYLELQKEVLELETELAEAKTGLDGIPPYEPQLVEAEDGRMQPSQIARRIGAIADWAMLLIPGAQIEAAFVKIAQGAKVLPALGKLTGIIEKAGKLAGKGDFIRDVLFSLKNISDHTRTSKRREQIAKETAEKIGGGAGKVWDTVRGARQNNEPGSILDYLTVEYWAGKVGEHFDRPPHMTVDKEYEAQYKEAKDKLVAEYREAQQKAYQKKSEMNLFKDEAERLSAKDDILRVDEEKVSKELAKREGELREAAKEKAAKKWRRDCADWYQSEVKSHLQNVIDSYTGGFPARLEEYQSRRLQALRDTLEKEQAAYDELKNAPEDDIALELQRVNEILEAVDGVYQR